jgi:hypothetical protein
MQNAKQLQHARFLWHVRCPSFLDSINNIPRSARSSRSCSVQNITIVLKLLHPTSDSFIWRWIFSTLSSVTTLQFYNILCFENSKYVRFEVFNQAVLWLAQGRCRNVGILPPTVRTNPSCPPPFIPVDVPWPVIQYHVILPFPLPNP